MAGNIINPTDFQHDGSDSTLVKETGNYLSTPTGLADFYRIPTDNTAPPSREQDFPEDSFAQDLYRNTPAFLRSQYDDKANEYETLKKAFGQKYNEEMIFGDSPRDAFASWDIARDENISDKQKKFKEYYPNGEFDVVPYNGKKITVARTDPSKNWMKIGESIPERLISGVADEATAGALVGETIGARTVPIVGGPLGAGFGSVIGDVMKTKIEQLRGYEKDKSLFRPEQVPLALANTAFSWYGNKGAYGAAKDLFDNQLATGDITKPVADAVKFAREEGLPDITFGQATTNPIIRAWYKQAVSLDEPTRKLAIQSNLAAVRKFTDLLYQNKNPDGLSKDTLTNLLDMARYNVGKIISSIKSKEITARDAGRFLEEGVDNWSDLMEAPGGYFSKLYNDVWAKGGDVKFDLSPTKAYIQKKYITGTLGKGVDKEVPTGLFLDKEGKIPITKTVSEDVNIPGSPSGELKSAIDTLMSLDSTITKHNAKNGNTYESFEQIKDLRARFGRLSGSPDPNIAGPAKDIYRNLTDTIENGTVITGANPADAAAAVDAFKLASSEYRKYQKLLELRPIAKLQEGLNAGNYVTLQDGLMRPGNYDAYKAIADIIPGAQDKLRAMFFTKMLAGDRNQAITGVWEDTITPTLRKFTNANDKESLAFLLKPGEQSQLLTYARNRGILENGLLEKLSKLDRDSSATAFEAIKNGKAEDLENLFYVAGGRGTATGDALRAGVLQRLYEGSVVSLDRYGDVFNYEKFRTQLSDMKNKGTLQKLFNKKEIDFLENIDNYVDVVKLDVGSGTSLQTASYAAGAVKVPAEAVIDVAKGKEEKAVSKVVKALVLPVSMRIAGRTLLNNAVDIGASRSAGKAGIPKMSALKFAAKPVATMLNQSNINYDTDIKEYDTDTAQSIPKHTKALKDFYFGGGAMTGDNP